MPCCNKNCKRLSSLTTFKKKKSLYYIFYGCVNSVHLVLCVYSCSYFERYILVLLWKDVFCTAWLVDVLYIKNGQFYLCAWHMKTWLALHKVMKILEGDYSFLIKVPDQMWMFYSCTTDNSFTFCLPIKYKHGIFIQMWSFALCSGNYLGFLFICLFLKLTGIWLKFQPTNLSTADSLKK